MPLPSYHAPAPLNPQVLPSLSDVCAYRDLLIPVASLPPFPLPIAHDLPPASFPLSLHFQPLSAFPSPQLPSASLLSQHTSPMQSTLRALSMIGHGALPSALPLRRVTAGGGGVLDALGSPLSVVGAVRAPSSVSSAHRLLSPTSSFSFPSGQSSVFSPVLPYSLLLPQSPPAVFQVSERCTVEEDGAVEEQPSSGDDDSSNDDEEDDDDGDSAHSDDCLPPHPADWLPTSPALVLSAILKAETESASHPSPTLAIPSPSLALQLDPHLRHLLSLYAKKELSPFDANSVWSCCLSHLAHQGSPRSQGVPLCDQRYQKSSRRSFKNHLWKCLNAHFPFFSSFTYPMFRRLCSEDAALMAGFHAIMLFPRPQRKRRSTGELNENEKWSCPHGCGQKYRNTSSTSIGRHLAKECRLRNATREEKEEETRAQRRREVEITAFRFAHQQEEQPHALDANKDDATTSLPFTSTTAPPPRRTRRSTPGRTRAVSEPVVKGGDSGGREGTGSPTKKRRLLASPKRPGYASTTPILASVPSAPDSVSRLSMPPPLERVPPPATSPEPTSPVLSPAEMAVLEDQLRSTVQARHLVDCLLAAYAQPGTYSADMEPGATFTDAIADEWRHLRQQQTPRTDAALLSPHPPLPRPVGGTGLLSPLLSSASALGPLSAVSASTTPLSLARGVHWTHDSSAMSSSQSSLRSLGLLPSLDGSLPALSSLTSPAPSHSHLFSPASQQPSFNLTLDQALQVLRLRLFDVAVSFARGPYGANPDGLPALLHEVVADLPAEVARELVREVLTKVIGWWSTEDQPGALCAEDCTAA